MGLITFVGGWGKPPVDEFGRPIYGDVFGMENEEVEEDELASVRWLANAINLNCHHSTAFCLFCMLVQRYAWHLLPPPFDVLPTCTAFMTSLHAAGSGQGCALG